MDMWIYHPKLRRRVWVDFKGKDVRPTHFREFAERIPRAFRQNNRSVRCGRSKEGIGGVGNWGTAKEYLEIMEMNGMLKPVSTEPKPAFIVGCTPEEELLALVQSIGSRIAARRYLRVKTIVEGSSLFLKSQPIVRLRENRPFLRFALEAVSQRFSK